jgi:ABC-type phosphate transport system substrate-binding protein
MKATVISVLIATLLVATTSAYAGVVVIAHPATGAADAKAIKKLFLGKSNELGGAAAVPVDQAANSAMRTEFLQKVLGQTPEDNKAHWTEQIFTGQGTPPKEVGDDAKVKAFVASTPGAVGYINESAVDATVKVLLK